MESANHTVKQWAPDLWQIDESYQDCYLLIGRSRAVLIDALASLQEPSLVQEIRSRTALPVDVLLTHAHFDHAGQELSRLAEIDNVTLWLGEEDVPLYEADIHNGVPASAFRTFREGDTWDLGGVTLEAFRIAGHTPGSYAFLDRAGRRAFTGDAFGIWLQLPHSLSMEVYRSELGRFINALKDIPDTVFFTGHLNQCGDTLWNLSQAEVLIEVCDKILSGELEGSEPPKMGPMAGLGGIDPFAGARVVQYKSVFNFVYRPDHLRD